MTRLALRDVYHALAFSMLGALIIGSVIPANAQTGMNLRQQCGVQARYHPHCAQWMGGVVDGILVGQALDEHNMRVCLPRGVSGRQILLIVRAYMRRNPQTLNESETAVIARAVHDAYPCGG